MKQENISTGIHDGWCLGLDPVGGLVGKLTGIRTNGSEGHIIKDGEVIKERLFDYDTTSTSYRFAKVAGATLGVGVNLLMVGFPQAVELVSDAVNYQKWNKE